MVGEALVCMALYGIEKGKEGPGRGFEGLRERPWLQVAEQRKAGEEACRKVSMETRLHESARLQKTGSARLSCAWPYM